MSIPFLPTLRGEIFEVAIWTDSVDAFNLVMPSGVDADVKRVTPASLTRILRTIAAFECVQRELGPVDRYEWPYNLGMSLLAAGLHACAPETVANWFRGLAEFARPS